ncbi:hypothetical protein CPB83DRAFT_650746 [Crepidotus variabilis]|uniref:F-box domain-containing protein n=1 Tax=Crepidotus variabilis TaxID=179855 RepID=A0A9P6JKJ9_9AGAR|nr:hypothetical protein CPB83DRAFT_650746 [Crepidotus variabilis]
MSTNTASDILRLPFEIVGGIFAHSVTPRPFFTTNIAKLPPKLPNPLPHHVSHGASQVCRKWRTIALSTPHMWIDIPIFRAIDKFWKGEKYTTNQLDPYLARSGGLSINIYLDIRRLDHYHDHSIVLDIVASFMREAHRWGSAVIVIPTELQKYLPSQIPPKLQKFNFRIRMRPHRGEPDYKLILGTYPSALQELIVDGYYRFSGSNEAEPERRIEALETFIGLPRRITDLKQTAASLKKCTFRGVHFMSVDITQGSRAPITFPLLETFELQGLNFDESTPFRYIDAPKLENLLVSSLGSIHMLSEMRQAAIASSWKLTSLTLDLTRMTWYSLAEVLYLLPTLHRLDINDPPPQVVFELSENPEFLSILQNLVLRLASLSKLRDLFTQLENLQKSRLVHPEGRKRKFDIAVFFPSPNFCCAAFDILFGYRSHSRPDKLTYQSEKLVGWRWFLIRQLLVGDSASSAKFIGLLPRRKAKYYRSKTRIPDMHNVHNVLTLLGSLDITSSDDIMASRLIEVLDAIAKHPLKMCSQDERFDVKSKTLDISVQLILQVQSGGYTWPPRWTIDEDGLSYRLPCDTF